MHYMLYVYFPYIPKVLTPCPSYPTQKEAVPGLEPEKIEAERVNVKLRTEQRIAQLYADAGRSSELVLKDWHGCLNTSCSGPNNE